MPTLIRLTTYGKRILSFCGIGICVLLLQAWFNDASNKSDGTKPRSIQLNNTYGGMFAPPSDIDCDIGVWYTENDHQQTPLMVG